MPPRPSSALQIASRMRHALVDTDAQALELQAHAADTRGCDGARLLLRLSRQAGRSSNSPSPVRATTVAAAGPIGVEIMRTPDSPRSRSQNPGCPLSKPCPKRLDVDRIVD